MTSKTVMDARQQFELAGMSPGAAENVVRLICSLIDERTTPETNDGLSKVYDAFGIGSAVRNTQTLLANVENAKRRSDCLSAIEREFFTRTIRYEDGEEADEADECALGWGAEPAEYVEQFRAALTERADLKTKAEPDFRALLEEMHKFWGRPREQEFIDAGVSVAYGNDLYARVSAALGDPMCADCNRRFSQHTTVITHDFRHRPTGDVSEKP